FVVGGTGLEPVAFGLALQRSIPLSYPPKFSSLKRNVIVRRRLFIGFVAEPGCRILFGVISWSSPFQNITVFVFLGISNTRKCSLLGKSCQNGMNRCLSVFLRLKIESHSIECANDLPRCPAIRCLAHRLHHRIGDTKFVDSWLFAT